MVITQESIIPATQNQGCFASFIFHNLAFYNVMTNYSIFQQRKAISWKDLRTIILPIRI